MENNIFADKSEEEIRRFYFTTRGVYRAKLDILKETKEKLNELSRLNYSDKSEIKKLKEQIKKIKIQIETIEFLYETSGGSYE